MQQPDTSSLIVDYCMVRFQDILVEAGFNDGKPITEEFFRCVLSHTATLVIRSKGGIRLIWSNPDVLHSVLRKNISGRHNPEIAADLFPHWTEERRTQFYEDKEARYRDMAGDCQRD